MFLLHSLVELLLFHPSLTNLMPVPTTISHHLYPVPSQYGTTSLTPHLQHTLLNHSKHTSHLFFCNCFNCFNRVHTGISCTYSYYVSVALLLLHKFSLKKKRKKKEVLNEPRKILPVNLTTVWFQVVLKCYIMFSFLYRNLEKLICHKNPLKAITCMDPGKVKKKGN